MLVEIKVMKDDGTKVAEFFGDGLVPQQFKTPYEKPATEGDYKFFGFSYQPIVQLTGKAGGF